MDLAETIRRFSRIWYIIVPGLVFALVAGIGAWTMIRPGYQRSATQLLLPGKGTLPNESSNPFLFLGGLTSVADVIVRAVGSKDVVETLTRDYPDSEVQVSRDPLNAGPAILITVTASSDQAAGAVVNEFVQMTTVIVADLQNREGIPRVDQITATTITIDSDSTLQQRKRIASSAGSALGIVVVTLFVSAMVDGLRRRRVPPKRSALSETSAPRSNVSDGTGPAEPLAPYSDPVGE